MIRTLKLAAFVLALSSLSAAQAAPPPMTADVATAVAAPGRTPDNVKLDESRKPAELLQFLGLKPGSQVLDMFGANKYWSEIMAWRSGPRAM